MANDFTIKSLRGGMNDTDPPLSLADDQCVLARNVEFNTAMLGSRRRGTDAITISDANISARDRVTFLHRHLPTTDDSTAQLWVLGVSGTATAALAYKDTTWHDVTISGTPNLAGVAQYGWVAQSLHGKLFIAYDSDVDRMHVWDGTSLRPCGLAEPAAPTGANEGSGSFLGTRFYREREVVLSGSTVLLQSEPSDVLTKAPSGTGAGIAITKSATLNSNATHWDLEASTDNANFYRIARTVVGTASVNDEVDYVSGYANATGAVLSEDIGNYSLITSGKYLTADQDRLLIAGSWEDAALASRVSWTPVYNDPGVGNDERIPDSTDNYLDLDGYEGGGITGMSATVNGYVYVFKLHHIYKLVRTGDRSRAYDAFAITKQVGALPGSIVAGLDQMGRPCLYFLDPHVGPCRLGANGLQRCGRDINTTWLTVNINAAKVVSRSAFDPESRQVHWWVATGTSDTPTLRLVLQTNECRETDEGVRRGWAVWNGNSATALAVCLFSSNIETGAARDNTLRPYIGLEGLGLIHLTDTGADDNGVAYAGHITTKPWAPAGLLNRFGVMAGAVLAEANADASLTITATRDFGVEQVAVTVDDFAPEASEEYVIRVLDSLSFSSLKTVQIEFIDSDNPTERWRLDHFSMKQTPQERA